MNEIELAAAAKRGDKAAFRCLIEVEVERVYPLAYSILTNRPDAEDAVHEAVVSAMESIGDLRDPAKFRPWFLQIVANQARNIRSRKPPGVPTNDELELESNDYRDIELGIDIRSAIDSLPYQHRQILDLYYSGLTAREVAEVVQRPPGTVRRVLSESYRMLRNSLGPDHDPRGGNHGP